MSRMEAHRDRGGNARGVVSGVMMRTGRMVRLLAWRAEKVLVFREMYHSMLTGSGYGGFGWVSFKLKVSELMWMLDAKYAEDYVHLTVDDCG